MFEHSLVYTFEKLYLMAALLAAIILTTVLAACTYSANLDKRRKFSLLALLTDLLVLQTAQFLKTAGSQTPGLEIRFQIGLKESIIQDNTGSRSQVMDAAPLIVESRTLLPIRYVTEPLGARVDWDAVTGKTTITLGKNVIELRVNSNTALVNGTPKMIDPANPKVMPVIVPPGRTFVPLLFVSENLGVQVHWNNVTQSITITR